MTDRSIVLRYHEIALKGDNRGWFEDRLMTNVKKLIERTGNPSNKVIVRQHFGRIEVEADWNDATQEALTRVFGLSSFSPMRKVTTEKSALLEAALEEFEIYKSRNGLPQSFRVLSRRSDKALAETSTEINQWIGSAIKEKYPSLVVDLKNPHFTLGVEVRFKQSFIWTERIRAQGGLPVGSNARVLSLMSGGLDSPVAAIQVLRRGSSTSFIHFYGAPFVGEEVLEKIQDLVRIVNQYQPDPQPLYVIPFGKIQEKIALATNPKVRTLLYRRMMIRIANEAAKVLKAKALVTGESLGQVASQTVENMGTINSVAELPILRPLITYDKDEIIEKAKFWGTFETSIRPGLDCCTLFADRHPTLRSTVSLLEEQEQKFPVADFVQEALAGVEKLF